MKVTQALAQPLQGVSQQEPHERRDGQVTDQVNMISDPVRGLTRRRGTRWVAEAPVGAVQQGAQWRSLSYTHAGRDFVVLLRTSSQRGDLPGADASIPPVLVYDATLGRFLDVQQTFSGIPDTLNLGVLSAQGVAAAVNVGRYVFMTCSDLPVQATTTPANDSTPHAVLWVRAGAYSREYKASVKLHPSGTVVNFSYTAPSAVYPGVLDTSAVPLFMRDGAGGTTTVTEAAFVRTDASWWSGAAAAALTYYQWNPTSLVVKQAGVAMTPVSNATLLTPGTYYYPPMFAVGPPAPDREFVLFHSSALGAQDITLEYTHDKVIPNPNYSKAVTDLTNAHQVAQAQWIIDAAAAISPEAIATKLRDAAIAAGVPTGDVEVVDGCVCFRNATDPTAEDGGDGTLFRAVGYEVSSSENVSPVHYIGTDGKPHVVKVRPSNTAENFYLKAEAEGSLSTLGFGQVRWVEGAGEVTTLSQGLFYGTVVGNTFYLAASAAGLQALTGPTDPPHPDWAVSTSGDRDSNPVPYFVGQPISMLATFQDRLLIGAGGVLACSRTGDYLNFFRRSALTLMADDPVEMYSAGAADDVLKHAVPYYKDLVVFGDRQQYLLSGRVPLTPTNAAIPVLSTHESVSSVPPLATGRLLFYVKTHGTLGDAGVAQLEPGANEGNPDSSDVSTQLDTYLGPLAELAHVPKPTTLAARTIFGELRLFTYLDRGPRRDQDAWSRLEFSPELGVLLAMAPREGDLLLFFYRQTQSGPRIVADRLEFDTAPDSAPHLDSMRPLPEVRAIAGEVSRRSAAGWFAATATGSLHGLPMSLQNFIADPENYHVGTEFTASVTPTNPFFRDGNGRPVLTGRDVVSSILLAYKHTGGFKFTVRHPNGSVLRTETFGAPTPSAGEKPCGVLRGNKDFEYTISSVTWLPMSVAPVAWTGQIYHRPQRL